VRLAPEVRDALLAQPWPGNVRELEITLRRAVRASGADGIVRLDHLRRALDPLPSREVGLTLPVEGDLDAGLARLEVDAMTRALAHWGTQAEAERRLGLPTGKWRSKLEHACKRAGMGGQ
jgi:transcriptional regulator with PAS, ATPase and Fis domain